MSNQPLGYYTWIADLRNGTRIEELVDGTSIKSVDVLSGLDVAQFWLIPLDELRSMILLKLQPGQSVRKYWSRTFHHSESGDSHVESPVVDKFGIADVQGVVHVWHYAFADGSVLVTSEPDF